MVEQPLLDQVNDLPDHCDSGRRRGYTDHQDRLVHDPDAVLDGLRDDRARRRVGGRGRYAGSGELRPLGEEQGGGDQGAEGHVQACGARWMALDERLRGAVAARPVLAGGHRGRRQGCASSVEVRPGVWGSRTTTSTFRIGAAQISTVDMRTHTLTVRRSGKIIKVIPVTTGKAGFRTRTGIKVIMSREAQVSMDAATTGTDPKDPDYYNLIVRWALRLTYSGEFLHAAPWSVGSQGRANVSHGCTGMSDAQARWMYDYSKIGDVVVYTGGTRALERGNGYTGWNMPFAKWAAGVGA